MTSDDGSFRISDRSLMGVRTTPEYAAMIEALVAKMVRTRGAPLRRDAEVARGGFGVIDVVRDEILWRTLVKKSLLGLARDNPILVGAFIHEASITAQLDHPNIIPVHDFGLDTEERLYFTMKLVRGQTLAQQIAELHAPERTDSDGYGRLFALVEVLLRVCDALAFAHSRRVIHCDLKAANIMVGRFGQVYLMDWGFAQILPPRPGDALKPRVYDPLPPPPPELLADLAFGTPSTMSPEQAHARIEEIDERSDVFSLGAVLYHLLAGHPPYTGDTLLERLRHAQDHRFARLAPSLSAAVPRPAELVRICERAMDSSPAQRYPSVEQFAEELGRSIRGGVPPIVRFAAGATIIAEGETADAAYLIQAGCCEAFVSRGGRRVRLETLGVGDVFGEGALLPLTRRITGVAACSDVSLLRIPATTLDHELGALGPWIGALVRGLARRARSQQERELSGARRPRRWWRPWSS